jgi:hypothetical protein
MGYDDVTMTISATLDKHGGAEQEEHKKLWKELQDEIRRLVEQEKYAAIQAYA